MSPKEKAGEIYYKFLNKLLKDSELIIKQFVGLNMVAIAKQTEITCLHAKECALVAADEIINQLQELQIHDFMGAEDATGKYLYWQEVKKEIDKL